MVTNVIKNASYKEIYDVHTDTQSTSILTVHAPVSNFPRQMLSGFFTQYRKFKYKGAKVTLQPAATLPADPLQVSYEAGEPTIDPRDMLNPILTRGYCGESLGYFLNTWMTPGPQNKYNAVTDTGGTVIENLEGNGFLGSSVDRTGFPINVEASTWGDVDERPKYLERLYYQSLGDPGFKKVHMQRGFKKFFRPLVYELATTTQRLAHSAGDFLTSDHTGATEDMSQLWKLRDGESDSLPDQSEPRTQMGGSSTSMDYTEGSGLFYDESALPISFYTEGVGSGSTPKNYYKVVRKTVPVLTSHKRPLGWLDTDTVVMRTDKLSSPSALPGTGDTADTLSGAANVGKIKAGFPASSGLVPNTMAANTTLPLINMGVFILPKAYKTEMYYRMVVTHYFDFAGFRPSCGLVSPFNTSSMTGPSLEWADWDDETSTFPSSSVTSTAKNVELEDVQVGYPSS